MAVVYLIFYVLGGKKADKTLEKTRRKNFNSLSPDGEKTTERLLADRMSVSAGHDPRNSAWYTTHSNKCSFPEGKNITPSPDPTAIRILLPQGPWFLLIFCFVRGCCFG